METQDEYQLVTNVEFDSQKKVTISVRHPLRYKDKLPRYVKFFVVFLLIVCAAAIIDLSVMLMINDSISAGLFMIWPVPLFAILVMLNTSKITQLVQLNMNFDATLSYLEFENNLVGQRQFLRNPSQLKIVVRFFPVHRTSGIKVISVELVGLGNDLDNIKVSKENVATFRFGSLKDAQDKLNEAQNSFKFLADWLQVPIVVEEYVLYEDSDTRYYF